MGHAATAPSNAGTAPMSPHSGSAGGRAPAVPQAPRPASKAGAGVRPPTGGKACPNAPGKPPWVVSAKLLRGPRGNFGLITGPASDQFVMTGSRTVTALPK